MPVGPRRALPPELATEPFTVAQGRSIGLGRKRLRGQDLDRPFRGVRLARAAVESPGEASGLAAPWTATTVDQLLIARCRALGLVLPEGAFFSHVTAARLWPLALPRMPTDQSVHVSVRAPHRGPRRTGTVGHEVTDQLTKVVVRQGLPVVDPATLFCQLACVISLHDLVAVGDSLILEPKFADPLSDRPWASIRELRERVELYRGRGKSAAVRAVELIRHGAESRPETLLRLAIVGAGLPEPLVNPDVFTAGGRFIGRGDLVYRKWRVIAEYDGEQHRRDTVQYEKDVQRLENFARHGWKVVRITGRSFFGDRPGSVRRVEQALVDAGWRR
jgi:hypothetical protein